MKLTWLHLFVYGLACFRLAVLLSQDTGPSKIFSRLRSFLKREAKHNTTLRKSDVASGISCLRCSSLWVSTPVAVFAYHHEAMDGWFVATGDIFLLAMALSALSILFHRAFPAR